MSVKTVFITGCSSGIGLATARLFHSKGWNVVATLRNPSVAPSELSSLQPASRLLITKCDVTDLKTIETAVGETVREFGKVDWVVNNAGWGQIGIFEATSREKAIEQLNVNLIGVMDVTRAFIPLLRRSAASATRNSMGIINVTSGGGHWSLPHSSLYSASKFGAEGFSEGLSYELASQNLAVKIVVPHGGITETAFATRMSQEIPHGSAEVEKAYDGFNKKMAVAYGHLIAGSATPANDVAQTIFEAATDGTDKLRYFINKDAEGFLEIRFGEKGERAAEEYITAMRKYFG